MIELNIPGRGLIQLEHLVSDVNGTLSTDGTLAEGITRMVTGIQDRLEVHLVTADTLGQQNIIDNLLGLQAVRVQPGGEGHQKAEYVKSLNPDRVVAIGQGANDAEMLKTAALGIWILSEEGSATESLLAADLVVPDIYTAFTLLDKPQRIVASLRK